MRFWAVLLVLALPLGAQEKPVVNDRFTVVESSFLPSVYYVGDLVELRLTLKPKDGVHIVKSRDIPNQNWVLIKDIDVKNDGPLTLVTIRFISFYPGTKTLPPIPLGDVMLNDVKIFTASTIDANGAPDASPVRDQLPLPQTELFIVLLLLLVFVCPVLVWKLWKPVHGRWQKIQRRYERRRPWNRLQKEIRRLGQRASGCSGPDFYTQMAQILKSYLSGRFRVPLEALTAWELEKLLAPLPPAWASQWVQLLRRADVIRFDGQDPSVPERLADLDALKKAAGYLESREALHVDL